MYMYYTHESQMCKSNIFRSQLIVHEEQVHYTRKKCDSLDDVVLFNFLVFIKREKLIQQDKSRKTCDYKI